MSSLLHPSFPLRFLSSTSPSPCAFRSHEPSFVAFCFATQFSPTNSRRNTALGFQNFEFKNEGFGEIEAKEEKKEEEGEEGERTLEIPVPVEEREEEEEGISGIPVPRQRYIPISKEPLLEELLSMFESQEEVDQFRLVASCLDSIIHAEHKGMLEEMRSDYALSHSPDMKKIEEVDKKHFCSEDTRQVTSTHQKMDIHDSVAHGSVQINDEKQYLNETSPNFSWDLRFLLKSSSGEAPNLSSTESRVVLATRFQRSFMKLLHNAQFEELSVHDLQLASALNTDYLLTLPIYIDWKRAYESKAIIFRRGFAAERQKGLLIAEKLDYIQSKLLQRIFRVLSRPLGKAGIWLNETWIQTGRMEWMQEMLSLMKKYWSVKLVSDDEAASDDELGVDNQLYNDLPMWLAAQRAVLRYEGLLSQIGPRGRLLRRLLSWIGFIPSFPTKTKGPENEHADVDPYLRSNFLSRITLGDIWKPARKESCENDLWKMFKAAFRILFSQSVLQEPAFSELILLYSEKRDQENVSDYYQLPSLRMKIYEKIPVPDLPVIFPHKKLSFRILDTVRLDVASILGLLAYFVNYKFEDIRLSPSSFLLDVIAVTALLIYVTRVALGYKQTRDRYQLLVNKTLYEKTLASGFGTVYFLLDASEQQQLKEAILAYAHLLRLEKNQVSCRKTVADMCERFMYDRFKEKVKMPIDSAMNTLLRLGLVTEVAGEEKIQVLPCLEAHERLKKRWDGLLGSNIL
ncbi:unnamed protein product [Victoria cruziana]